LTGEDISIVIVSRELDPDFEECISRTRTQKTSPTEVIVVTAGDTTGFAEKWQWVRFIHTDAKRSKARNLGWRSSRSELICFWEADSVFNDRWLSEVVGAFNRGADAVIDRRKCYHPSGYFLRSWDSQFDIRYSDYKPFSAWAFRKEVLVSINGFDENLDYAEDTDVGLRLKERGFKILLAPEATQMHKGEPRSFTSMIKRRFIFGYRKSQGFFRKHPKQYPSKRVLATAVATTSLCILMVLNYFTLLVILAISAYSLFLAKAFIDSRGIVPLRYSPGIAFNRITGGMGYHWGVITGSIVRIGKPSPWEEGGKPS